MFYELCKNKKKNGVIKFLLGEAEKCELLDQIVVSNVVSKAPFPYLHRSVEEIAIPTKSDANKHIWRIQNLESKYVMVVASGDYLLEARRRMRRTLNNLSKYDRDLQYRTDYGFRRELLLMKERYDSLCSQEWKPKS